MLYPIFAICLPIIVSSSVLRIESTNPVLKIKNGYIKGIVNRTIELQNEYYAFRAIPFAEPPVGNLRFEPPIPKQAWDGILDATEEGSPCIQGTGEVTGSEDCLFINVYTPTLVKSKQLAVMIWIHGGMYTFGNSQMEDFGPDYFLDRGVIIVSSNYRLGILGFLSTGDEVVPGNMAMKDHILGLEWVQENIEYFGGDPKKVTIFGGSAGSISVSYLLLSPLAKGLFSRAIMESGVSLSWFCISRKITDRVFKMAKTLGLEASDTRTLVNSLKKLNSTYLQEAAMNGSDTQPSPMTGLLYAPVVEHQHIGAFLTSTTYELLSKGEFISVPTIIGFTSLEMNIAFSSVMKLFILLYYDRLPKHLVPTDMNITDYQNATLVGEEIKKHYFGSKLMSLADYEMRKFMSDEMFVRPTRETVRFLSKKSNVYYYRFAYEGDLSGIKYRPSPGAVHSEEVFYMWRYENHPSNNTLDFLTRKRMVTMWTNFAKYADPTPKLDAVLGNLLWLPSNSFGDDNFAFMNINKTLTLELNPQKADMNLWDNLYHKYA